MAPLLTPPMPPLMPLLMPPLMPPPDASTDVSANADQGPARPTGGCGAVAVLVGPNAPLVIDMKTRASYACDVWDFFKPDMTSEYPRVRSCAAFSVHLCVSLCSIILYTHVSCTPYHVSCIMPSSHLALSLVPRHVLVVAVVVVVTSLVLLFFNFRHTRSWCVKRAHEL